MAKSILVAYASGSGSTGEVAQAIADELRAPAVFVDVLAVDRVVSVESYDAVVVGSSIRAGRWLPEGFDFVDDLALELRNRPVAFFTTCLAMVHDTAANRRTVLAYMAPVLQIDPLIIPVGLGLFAGSLDPSRRLIFPAGVGPFGDYRDWQAIRAWARHIRPALLELPGAISDRPRDLAEAILGLKDMAGVELAAGESQTGRPQTSGSDANPPDWSLVRMKRFQSTNLRRANLIGAVMQDANLKDADLSEAILNGADLTGSNLTGANLTRADLNWANLSGTDCRGANFEQANLNWANLHGAQLDGVNFQGAHFNDHTRWPSGFSPGETGAVNISLATPGDRPIEG